MELQKLKEECNILIGNIEKISVIIKSKEEKVRQLEGAKTAPNKSLAGMKEKMPEINSPQLNGRKSFYKYYPVFIAVMKELSENREFSEYRNYSRYEKKYKKVKKNILDRYIKEKTEYEKREFYDLASDYMLIRNDEGRYTYKNDSTEVIYISRKVLENSGCF